MCGQVAQLQKMLARGEDDAIDRANFLMNVCAGVEQTEGLVVSLFAVFLFTCM